MISYHPHIKRFLDIALSLSAIVFFLPLFAVVYILIRMDRRFSVFCSGKNRKRHDSVSSDQIQNYADKKDI